MVGGGPIGRADQPDDVLHTAFFKSLMVYVGTQAVHVDNHHSFRLESGHELSLLEKRLSKFASTIEGLSIRARSQDIVA